MAERHPVLDIILQRGSGKLRRIQSRMTQRSEKMISIQIFKRPHLLILKKRKLKEGKWSLKL